MTQRSSPFDHSTPALYDRYMSPLLFEPYATVLAQRAAALGPRRILETAAGTGVVTRAVHAAVPQAQVVATDVNRSMLEVAARRLRSHRVTFLPADAQTLPFADEGFDLVLCQFGVMFFTKKMRAYQEARRVLRSAGQFVMVTFDELDRNPVPRAAAAAVAEMFPDNPPAYMERGPFSYGDAALIQQDLLAAGFTIVTTETVALTTRVRGRDAARGMVLGSPFRAEIERRDSSALDAAVEAVTAALVQWDGRDAPMSAHVVTARQ